MTAKPKAPETRNPARMLWGFIRWRDWAAVEIYKTLLLKESKDLSVSERDKLMRQAVDDADELARRLETTE